MIPPGAATDVLLWAYRQLETAAMDLAAVQDDCAAADDLEPEPLLPAEVEEITFEEHLFQLGVALMWAAWGTR